MDEMKSIESIVNAVVAFIESIARMVGGGK